MTTNSISISDEEKYIIVKTGDNQLIQIPFHLIPRFPYLDEERDLLDFDSEHFDPNDCIIPLPPTQSQALLFLIQFFSTDHSPSSVDALVHNLSNDELVTIYFCMCYLKITNERELGSRLEQKIRDLITDKSQEEIENKIFPNTFPSIIRMVAIRLGILIGY